LANGETGSEELASIIQVHNLKNSEIIFFLSVVNSCSKGPRDDYLLSVFKKKTDNFLKQKHILVFFLKMGVGGRGASSGPELGPKPHKNVPAQQKWQ
jgi:hypothetical protein